MALLDAPQISLSALEHPVPNQPFRWLRYAAACFSFANLSFIRIWAELLAYQNTDVYFMKHIPGPADYAAAMASVVLLALLLLAVVWVCYRYLPAPAARVAGFAGLGLVLIPLNGVRVILSGYSPNLTPYLKSPLLRFIHLQTVLFVILPLAAVVLWFTWKWQWLAMRIAIAGLLSLLPFAALTFGHALWDTFTYRGRPVADGPSASRVANPKTSPHVVWIIFDEWDFRLTFLEREASLSMPAVDRFRAESVYATNAHSPAMDTGTSLPSLITGRRLRMSVGQATFSAEQLEDLSHIPWNQTPTVFSAARQAGFNTSLIGWYLPYCRVLNSYLTDCAWWPMPGQSNSTGDTFWQKIGGQTLSLVETDSLSPVGQSLAVRAKARMYLEFLARAKAAVRDREGGLVFLHVPVPHASHSYNRFTGRFDLKNHPLSGYIDSLALLDRTLAELRQEMETSGQWDRTTMLISADHPFRASKALDGKFDVRVPFLLHMPGQSAQVAFDSSFNTIVTADLVMAVLNGSIRQTPDAVAWLDSHRRDPEAPVH